MRQVLTWRFVATLAVIVGLVFLVDAAFVGRGSIARIVGPTEPIGRQPDLISLVLETDGDGFAMSAVGTAERDLVLKLPPPAAPVRIFAGTPGEVTCANLTTFGGCAVLAELLGDSVSWFALVPMGESFRFELPAIVELDGGLARLVNGWQIPYASIIDRSRCEPEFESFSELLRTVGQAHTALYDLGRSEITAVAC